MLFLAARGLIVGASIYKYVNTPQYSRDARVQGSAPQIIFLEGFNEYRMFMNTIPCDSQRLEESTSTQPPPTPPPRHPHPQFPPSTNKEERGRGRGGERGREREAHLWRNPAGSWCLRLSLLRSLLDGRRWCYKVHKERQTPTWRRGAGNRLLAPPHQGTHTHTQTHTQRCVLIFR